MTVRRPSDGPQAVPAGVEAVVEAAGVWLRAALGGQCMAAGARTQPTKAPVHSSGTRLEVRPGIVAAQVGRLELGWQHR